MRYLAILTVCLCMTEVARAQTAPSRFDVSGFGRVFYEPDAYDLSFGIVSENVDIQKCKDIHISAVREVKAFLDGKKGSIASLKQDATMLSIVWRPKQANPKLLEKLYVFKTMYTARIKDPTSLLDLQEGLITAGVTDLYGLDTFCDELPELLAQARKQAIQDAKAKADLLASELGWTLSGPISISINDGDSLRPQKASENYGSRSRNYDPTDRPEFTNYVSSQVSVQFGYLATK